jgi:hypothetical protein
MPLEAAAPARAVCASAVTTAEAGAPERFFSHPVASHRGPGRITLRAHGFPPAILGPEFTPSPPSPRGKRRATVAELSIEAKLVFCPFP